MLVAPMLDKSTMTTPTGSPKTGSKISRCALIFFQAVMARLARVPVRQEYYAAPLEILSFRVEVIRYKKKLITFHRVGEVILSLLSFGNIPLGIHSLPLFHTQGPLAGGGGGGPAAGAGRGRRGGGRGTPM